MEPKGGSKLSVSSIIFQFKESQMMFLEIWNSMKFAKRYVSKKPSHALPTVTQLIPNAFLLVFEMN